MNKNIGIREYEQNILFQFVKKLKETNPELSFVLYNGFLGLKHMDILKRFFYNFETDKRITWIIGTNGDFELPRVDSINSTEWYDSWQNNKVLARNIILNGRESKDKLSGLDVVEFNIGLANDTAIYRAMIIGGEAKKIKKNKTL